MSRNSKVYLSTAIGLSLASLFLVPAQSLNAAENEGVSNGMGLEEIVVTARKREESLQKVPISVSAFSEKDLAAMSVSDLREAAQFAPNVVFNNTGPAGSSAPAIFIRGIGQAASNEVFFDPGVGIYLDGVFVGRPLGLDLDMVDVQRLEILRGPQGTLFGKNTVGGAINLITAKPNDELGGKLELITGRFNRIDAKLSLNLPLVPGKLAANFSGAIRKRDGFGERLDIFTGDKIGEMGDVDKLSGRVKINWVASENVEILLALSATKVRETGWTRRVLDYNADLGLLALLSNFLEPDYGPVFLEGLKLNQSYATGPNTNHSNSWDTALTINWNLGDVSVKSITSYKDLDLEAGVDPDGSIYDIIKQTNEWEQKQFSQEFLINGASFDDKLDWVMGLYYYSENVDYYVETYVLDPLWDFLGADLGGSRIVDQNIKSYSAFGQATYAMNEKLSATVGLRYTYEEKSMARQGFRLHTGVENILFGERSENFDSFSPRFGLEYQLNKDFLTYVSVAQGFKSGGLNGRSMASNDFLPFDSETVWTYEFGLKSEWFDRRLLFNTALYYSDYKNIQFQSISSDPDTAQPITIIDNAGKAEIKGFEAELKAVVAEGFILTANVGYTDAKYTEIKQSVGISTDNRFPEIPEWSYALAANYTVEIGNSGSLSGRVDWTYRSKVFHDAPNSEIIAQDGYGLLNARLSFETSDGNWTISTFVTNLADKKYILGGANFLMGLGFAEGQIGRPREWGASVQYRF
ncbi:MAG: hypothetical protein COB54_00065 [Alphaproteobacteria bacterium]|nr:MAG: hypothetical protein COB54_00065 [Alphaproteobacteria bacterium]